ncbi:hypothetical protein DXG03_009249 [Asterophora parasitica]|uniref:Uncharacterized protein n=1 Tax=Asterophora parasitica TaxID=117018 RepID=A0A9P7K7U0_9AGAR|nr:hypothetical protein DXG03_009249 [Asterophora parasitica]
MCPIPQSYALSHTFNRRNLEFFWYPAVSQQLEELIGDDSQLSVAQRFPFWIGDDVDSRNSDPIDPTQAIEPNIANISGGASLPLTALSESQASRIAAWRDGASGQETWVRDSVPFLLEDGDDDDDEPDSEPAAFHDHPDDNDFDDSFLHNITASSINTISAPNAVVLEPGYRVVSAKIPVITEAKRFGGRAARSADELNYKVDVYLAVAKADLQMQAAVLFHTRPDATVVTAIGTTGPYWTSAQILPKSKEMSDAAFAKEMKFKYSQLIARDTITVSEWSMPVRFDTPESDERFRAIRTSIYSLST